MGSLINAIQRSQDSSLRTFASGCTPTKIVKQEMSTGHMTEESGSAHNGHIDLLVQSKRVFEKASKAIEDLENLESLRCNSIIKEQFCEGNEGRCLMRQELAESESE